MALTQRIEEECAKAVAHFATMKTKNIQDIRDVARIVADQPRRGSDERAVARTIAQAADQELARRSTEGTV